MLTAKEASDRRWKRKRDRLVCELLAKNPSLNSYEALRRVEQKLRDQEHGKNAIDIEKVMRRFVSNASEEELAALAEAKKAGLYLGFFGPVDQREWRIYLASVGSKLGWWRPKHGLYQLHGKSGKTQDLGEIFRLANGGTATTSRVRSNPAGDGEQFCGSCGAAMVRRMNAKTGRPFLGCPEFPKCTFTIGLQLVDAQPPHKAVEPVQLPRKVGPRTVQREKLAAELMAADPTLTASKATWLASRQLRALKRAA